MSDLPYIRTLCSLKLFNNFNGIVYVVSSIELMYHAGANFILIKQWDPTSGFQAHYT